MDSKIKKSLLSFLIIAVVGGSVFAALSFYQQKKEQNREHATIFRGTVQKIEGNSVTVKGTYDIAGKPEYAKAEEAREVTLDLNNPVKFVRVVRSLPPPAELEKLGTYQYDQFPMERQEVNFEQLLADLDEYEGLPLKITSTDNIFAKKKFAPSEIEYHVSVFSQPLSP